MADAKLISTIHSALGELAGVSGLDMRSKKFVDVMGKPYYASGRSLQLHTTHRNDVVKSDGVHGEVVLPSENQSIVKILGRPRSTGSVHTKYPLTVLHQVPWTGLGPHETTHDWSNRAYSGAAVRERMNPLHPESEDYQALQLHHPDFLHVNAEGGGVFLHEDAPNTRPLDRSVHDVINEWHRLPRVGYVDHPTDNGDADWWEHTRLMDNAEFAKHHEAISQHYPSGGGNNGVRIDSIFGSHIGMFGRADVGRGNIHVRHHHDAGAEDYAYDPENESLKRLSSWKRGESGLLIPNTGQITDRGSW